MNPVQLVMLVCWSIFFVYWLISARSAKAFQETRGWLRGKWSSILLDFGFMFMILPEFVTRVGLPPNWLSRPLMSMSPSTPVDVVITLLLTGGLVLAILARRTIAGNWSVAVGFQKGHELVTSGPYRFVRHPIYTGLLLMLLGTTLYLDTLSAMIGFIIVLITLRLKAGQEEALLAEHFLEEYPVYKQHTKSLIPFLW
jgi:protein-S-isoprenylcysteine O-methyltransferase Ste14